ncbi:hypothetical protein Mal4_19570 [Maioricimonas rarisocia]|uniref:Uncharacterized protein n=1 Tax=Maioricimonas rarisocia TaxID=2528026 RepID=A0A517Z572_9PLAN|nr:hypothetical protein [Maioricimonas rarisocia]QDU37642.1 hypothetical protein Mal4_19570 [Maioricimonas rarisocia]
MDTKDLLPIVGQKKLFDQLISFRDDCLADSTHKLSSFFVLHGGWGVGKSRVGHEICLEAIDENVEWIVEGKKDRVFQPSLQDGILPVFVRYAQITTGRFGEDLNADTWIPTTIVESLSRLIGLESSDDTRPLSRNQDRLRQWTENALHVKSGWTRCREELSEALRQENVHAAARGAMAALKNIGIGHALFVVDEIEDITDVEVDGLQSEERTAIDQALLTVIPRVIKSEEVRQEFAGANFLLLCSRAVGDLLKQVRAIERRTVRHELRTNSFSDIESLFNYLRGTDVGPAIKAYPKGLKEAAFFAADRNFGWFNVIMNRLHANLQGGGPKETAELLRQFAERDERVFDKEAVGSLHIEQDEDQSFIQNAMYGLLPQPIGDSNGVGRERAVRLLARKDASGTKLFTKVREIKPPQDVRITTHLVNCGFRVEPGAIVNLPGEARFSLKDVLESLRTYSQIALPEDRRDHLLICEDQAEFTSQVGALSPYGDRAGEFAVYLHGLLIDDQYAVGNGGGPSEFLAPSFTFLQKFHHLNRRQHRVEGYLRDTAKNSTLEHKFKDVCSDPKRREQALIHGIAWAWDEPERIAVQPVSGCSIPAIELKTSLAPLSLGPDGVSILMYVRASTQHAEIEQELGKLARRAASPVVLVVEDTEERVEELRDLIDRSLSKIAPFVVLHQLTTQVGNFLARLGVIGLSSGDALKLDDMRTNHFNGVVQGARQHLYQVLERWVTEQVGQRGLVLRPLFYGSRVSEDDLIAFAKGYAALLAGKSYHDVKQVATGVFVDDTERDRFEKMVTRQVDPGTKYHGEPLLQLVVDEEGERKAVLPRCLLTVMERCSRVQLKRNELEGRFLFEVPDSVKTRDVIRHLTTIMHTLGLIEVDGDQVRQVSRHMLEGRVTAAENWLDSQFDRVANTIRAIHHEHGTKLIDINSKDARHGLKKAANELAGLDLDFTSRPWDELNRTSSDGMPVFEQQLRKALGVIGEVQKNATRVFDTTGDRAFRYSPDVLHDFEKQYGVTTYPLWKRVRVLHGFYVDLDRRRKLLIKQIDEIAQEVDTRVPELDDGQKAFPTQAISRPLDAFRQELDFSADRPNRTVTAGGSSLGIVTVGYKLCCDPPKFEEAINRLGEITAELEQPGKLVAGFKGLLSVWEGLRDETEQCRERMVQVEAFFADAPAEVRSKSDLDVLKNRFDELHYALNEGGIREGTDNREGAGEQIWQLVNGLKSDLDKVRTGPASLLDDMNGLEARAVQTLEVQYQEQHGALMRAWTGVRLAKRENPEAWPRERKKTWSETKAVFDEMVERMQAEGSEYFSGESGVTFNDYLQMCQIVLKGQEIDWESDEMDRRIPGLKRLKLVKLELQ